MARISTYITDESVQATDKLLGSNAGGETKNFKLGDITDFLNTSGLINLNGVVEQFIIQDVSLTRGKFKLPNGGNGVSFSSITSLKVSTKSIANVDISDFFNHLIGQGLKISNVSNLAQFGQFVLVSITKANEGDTFATFNLSFLGGSGSLIQDNFYLFNLDNTGRTDKNFVTPNINFTAGQSRTITHNLAKFPAVTTVDSAGSHIVGDVQHTDNNNFDITFKASFQGKVYVN